MQQILSCLFVVRRKAMYHVALTFLLEVQSYEMICPDYQLTVLFLHLLIATWSTKHTARELSELL